jgi:hypothetical protein
LSIPTRYATGTAFRRALETWLKDLAAKENTDLQRLRRQVAFDRFLCRLFKSDPENWVLKGGYAMELRIQGARTTKDIDLTFRGRAEEAPDLLERLQSAALQDLGDGFDFRVGEASMDLERAPYGGARYPVEARVDGRTFAKFHLDAGVGDAVEEPLELLQPREWLEFAEVQTQAFPALPAEQQFAEKYHAYTTPWSDRPNSRVRDLVDMLLLVRESNLKKEELAQALQATFSRRDTHSIPNHMPDPPDLWTDPFLALAASCGIETTAIEAAAEVRTALERLTT